MEEDVREVLRQTIDDTLPPRDLVVAIRWRVVPLCGVELDLLPRDSLPEPPDFDYRSSMIILDTDAIAALVRPSVGPRVAMWSAAQGGSLDARDFSPSFAAGAGRRYGAVANRGPCMLSCCDGDTLDLQPTGASAVSSPSGR